MLITILLVVLVLVTLVAAYMGAKSWHWAHVTVVVLLFFTVVGFSFLAAKAVSVRHEWQEKARQAMAQLEPLEQLSAALSRGTKDRTLINQLIAREVALDEEAERIEGLVDLRHELRLATQTSGRVWRNAQPRVQGGAIAVQIEFPSPLGIAEGAILFAFEQGEANPQAPGQGRQYLGEFRVTAADNQVLALEPVLTVLPRDDEAQRLAVSRGPWVLYETMPADRHEVFAGFTNDQLRQLLPAGSVDEYLRDGTPWDVDDGEWTKEGRNEAGEVVGPDDWDDSTKFVYRRRLRDYALLFNDLAKERFELIARGQALTEDINKLKATLESAEQQKRLRVAEQRKLKTDLAGVAADRQAIEAHLAGLEQRVARGRSLLQKVSASNAALAQQIASLQSSQLGGVDFNRQPVRSRGATDVDPL